MAKTVFTLTNSELRVDDDMKRSFEENGYIIVKSLLSSEEVEKLARVLEIDGGIRDNAILLNDGHGRNSRLSVWSHPGKDITGMLARSDKVVGTIEELMGGEVYHYHTKLVMKEARTGGSFVWHQDYGYWYQNTCLFPDMASVFIAIDKTDIENGCLKILKGSHKAGRIDHTRVGGQNGADMTRVEMLMKKLELINVELEAGDALFFHSNVLHRSEQNNSDRRRWAFILSYNMASNDPVLPHHHPQYTPLIKVRNEEILACDCTDLTGKGFMDPADDKSIEAQKEVDVNKASS